MPSLILYSLNMSPPCRAVLLTAEALGLNLEIRETILLKGEQLTEEFVKLNPQHTIPTLIDDGDVFWDSHAIMCYLVGKYAKDDSLYPKDLKKRAVIDQRLHFDSGILFPLVHILAVMLFFHKKNPLTEEKLAQVNETYDFLNKFLEGKKWLTGDSYTLADISCLPDVAALNVLVPVAPYPNVARWLKTCEELPGYATAFLPGATVVNQFVRQLLSTVS